MALMRRGGRVLSVSRKTDPTALGLPGGSVEPGESKTAAILREVLEEVGVTITRMTEIFVAQCREHEGTTFIIHEWEGEPRAMETGVVEWVLPERLYDPGQPFRVYNAELFSHLAVIPKEPPKR